MISIDRRRWREQGVPSPWARDAERLADAYLRMGAQPTFTCAPYDIAEGPALGEHIAWAESNAIAYANGVLGARTNRYGDLIDACAALTGRVPLSGYHLDAGRHAALVIKVVGVEGPVDDSFWPVLGYIAGAHAGDRIPAIIGAPVPRGRDELKAFAAAAATSGAVGMSTSLASPRRPPPLRTRSAAVSRRSRSSSGHRNCAPPGASFPRRPIGSSARS